MSLNDVLLDPPASELNIQRLLAVAIIAQIGRRLLDVRKLLLNAAEAVVEIAKRRPNEDRA